MLCHVRLPTQRRLVVLSVSGEMRKIAPTEILRATVDTITITVLQNGHVHTA